MVQPFDYSLNAMDPVQALQSGMAFGQQQRAGEQDMRIRDDANMRADTAFQQQNTLFDQSQADRAAAMEAQRAVQADFMGLADKIAAGTVNYNDFAELALRQPEAIDSIMGVWNGLSTERKANDTAVLYRGVYALKAGRPDLTIAMLEERADAAENSGDKEEADSARALAEIIKANPESGMAVLGVALQQIDPDAATAVFGNGRSVQSTNAYANGTTVTVFSDGSKEVTDAAGTVISGPNAQAAVDAAIASEATLRGGNASAAETGKLEAQLDLAGEVEATKEAGKQAIAKSGEAFDALGRVNSNIVTIDTAIAALDAGANSGAIAKYFPNVSAASASLENAMNRLGLDVIGSVTFGPLSEGEMRLAMETAVPRNLDEPALKKWLQDKKAAQEKAAEALYNAAVYLGKPGNTLEKFLIERGSASGSGSPPPTGQGGDDLDALLREAEGL